MGVYRVSVTRCCRGGVIGEGVEVDDGVPGHHVVELRCDVFRGSSLEVLGFLVHFEVCVPGRWRVEVGMWLGVGRASELPRGLAGLV